MARAGQRARVKVAGELPGRDQDAYRDPVILPLRFVLACHPSPFVSLLSAVRPWPASLPCTALRILVGSKSKPCRYGTELGPAGVVDALIMHLCTLHAPRCSSEKASLRLCARSRMLTLRYPTCNCAHAPDLLCEMALSAGRLRPVPAIRDGRGAAGLVRCGRAAGWVMASIE